MNKIGIVHLLMKKIVRLLIFIKYFRENVRIHQENFKMGRLISLSAGNHREFLNLRLYKTYDGIININKVSLYFMPSAVLDARQDEKSYLSSIGDKSRNMIRKALKNNFTYAEFDWNCYRDDVYEINTSTSFRQGKKMSDSYTSYPEEYKIEVGRSYEIIHTGVFFRGKLVAYAEIHAYNEIGFVNKILGNAEYLKMGIMNLLIYSCYISCTKIGVSFLTYITMKNIKKNTLSAFKKRVGFTEYTIINTQ